MQVVGWTQSQTGGITARVYRFKSLEKTHVVRSFPTGKGAVFSFFAKSVSGPEVLRVSVQSPFCMQTKDCLLTPNWQRYEVAARNDIAIRPLDVFMSCQNSFRLYSDIGIEFPQVESGLFATSPIPPDVLLPSVGSELDNEHPTRDADRLWLDEEKTGISIDSTSSTVIFVGSLIPNTDQILEDQFLALISFVSLKNPVLEIGIGVSGRHHSRFVIRKRGDGGEDYTVSRIIAGKDEYFVCAVFDRNVLSIIINGSIAMRMNIPDPTIFKRTYIGCSHGEIPDSFNGRVAHYQQFATALLYPRILEIYRELCPNHPQHTYNYMLDNFRYSLVKENEIAVMDACLKDEGFSYFISQIKFSFPEIYNQFAPGKHFLEEDVRDWVWALIRRPSTRASRESYSKVGRTDLALSYDALNEAKPNQRLGQTYRIEFKIWGRDGYKDAPSQPLKYMNESELVGAFAMLDRRAYPKIEDFEAIIAENTEFPCLAIREIPLLDNNLRYFVSFHHDSRYRMPRMMINIHLPISE